MQRHPSPRHAHALAASAGAASSVSAGLLNRVAVIADRAQTESRDTTENVAGYGFGYATKDFDMLRQTQRMEALGQMLSGVAHDLGNLLTIISGSCEALVATLACAGEVDAIAGTRVEAIRQAVRGASGLTRRLLAFGRKQPLHLENVNLNGLLHGLQALLHPLLGSTLVVDMQLQPDLWQTYVDSSLLEQVVLNLLANARDAMPQGGTVTVVTANLTYSNLHGTGQGELPFGEYVLLSVTDTGVGMNEDTRARVFEPFFTTKPEGQGSGLGLAIALGVVKQFSGHIFADSRLGRGTTFRILLPRTRDAKNYRTQQES